VPCREIAWRLIISIEPNARVNATSTACISKPIAASLREASSNTIRQMASDRLANSIKFAPLTPPFPEIHSRAALSVTPVQVITVFVAWRLEPNSDRRANPTSSDTKALLIFGFPAGSFLPVSGNIFRFPSCKLVLGESAERRQELPNGYQLG
jgi:hypothetical protein